MIKAIINQAGVSSKSFSKEKADRLLNTVLESITAGYKKLKQGVSALIAVETSIKVLEDSGVTNSGIGSRTQLDGKVRMDASIMDGSTLNCGAVAGVTEFQNPISLAKFVMEKTKHSFFLGDLAKKLYLEKYPNHPIRKNSAFKSEDNMGDTVGALALDQEQRLAAGTSTGGIGNALAGRIGDSCVIGAGTYADKECAISCTGNGDDIIKMSIAKRISELYKNTPRFQEIIPLIFRDYESQFNRSLGIIMLNNTGEYYVEHNGKMMIWSCIISTDEKIKYGINPQEVKEVSL